MICSVFNLFWFHVFTSKTIGTLRFQFQRRLTIRGRCQRFKQPSHYTRNFSKWYFWCQWCSEMENVFVQAPTLAMSASPARCFDDSNSFGSNAFLVFLARKFKVLTPSRHFVVTLSSHFRILKLEAFLRK